MAKGKARRLRLEQLNLPQPAIRSGREQLDELAVSVEAVGVLVPLVVRELSAKKARKHAEYAVIAGAGRLEALRMTGAGPRTQVPCVVVDVDDAEATLLALVENVVREDMRPFDEAEAARVLIEEYGYTQVRVAEALGQTQGGVSRKLAVFRLDAKVVAALRKGEIEMQAAKKLLPLEDDRSGQRAILTRMIAEGLSAKEVGALVAKRRFGKEAVKPLSFAVKGAGKVEARTTPSGKLRVTLEAEGRDALDVLWASLKKRV